MDYVLIKDFLQLFVLFPEKQLHPVLMKEPPVLRCLLPREYPAPEVSDQEAECRISQPFLFRRPCRRYSTFHPDVQQG